MARLIEANGFGLVAADFEPATVADVLNKLRVEDINAMKQCSVQAARHLNADVEMAKLEAIIHKTLGGS